jgi:hypothetical protein
LFPFLKIPAVALAWPAAIFEALFRAFAALFAAFAALFALTRSFLDCAGKACSLPVLIECFSLAATCTGEFK